MRMSRLLLRTLREAPSDAEAASHQLLVRAGYIRRLVSGVYTFLPLGLRVLDRVSRVVREELDGAGAQELLLPTLHPLELWQRSGRDQTMADVLMHLSTKGGELVLGPTHEEVATVTVSPDLESYRDLPVTVYQVQTKFRDEARPRFGLLRTREFIMCDGYSFDASAEAMGVSYRAMHEAYTRIFERLGLSYQSVEAAAGAIGGDVNHEFMVPSAIGEDRFARCPACGYAANVEAAEAGEPPVPAAGPADGRTEPAAPGDAGQGDAGQGDAGQGDAGQEAEPLAEHHTPGRPGIDLVVEHFADRGLTAAGMLKCIALLDGAGQVVVALVPGDREVKVGQGLRPFADADFAAHPELVKGYIGPMGLQERGARVVADWAVRTGGPWVTGANRPDHHVTGAVLGRDFSVDEWAAIATVAPGDPCPRCGAGLELVRAVEAAHTFQLGLMYSTKLGATFRDEDGAERPYWMGCYGIGVTRLPAVAAEEHHDDAGLTWPPELAPYDVHLVALGPGRDPDVARAAEGIYQTLVEAGLGVLYDDRDVSAGVKFADADLLGMPVQLIVGSRGLGAGVVERKARRSGERDRLELGSVVAALSRAPA